MSTKTFSSRVDAGKLAVADAIVRNEFGVSYGQYCGGILLDYISSTGSVPKMKTDAGSKAKVAAFKSMKNFSDCNSNTEVGHMSDDEIKALIGGKYDH